MRRQILFKAILIAFAFSTVNSHAAIDVEMILNNAGFESYSHFKAELFLNNHDEEIPGAEIFGILEIDGVYYFWPDFGTEVNYQTVTIAKGESYVPFLEFDFPDIDDIMPYGPLRFWGAWYMDADRYGYDVSEFWLDREHKWTPTPPPTFTATATSTSTPSPTAQNFVFIPAGTFQMGSPSDEMCRYSDEGPVHSVTITHGFYIQSTEVTQQQWVDVFGSNPSNYTGMNRPVEEVTWYDCCIYCNNLSQAEGLTPCYYSDASFTTVFDGTPPVTSGTVYWNQSANGYRLPTEAEWEYACRAGTTTAYNSGLDNTDCSDDPNLDLLGRYYYNGGSSSHHADVGSYQANNRGLYDMHGNVWEWCWDLYSSGYYSSSPSTDPTGPSSGSGRVVRSGSWYNSAGCCRSAYRDYRNPGRRRYYLGFRPLRATTFTPTQTPTPTWTPETTPSVTPTALQNFVFIPAGTFQMGSPSYEMCRYSDEGPVHSVTITHGFYIQSTEVTQQQWVDVFGNNPSRYPGMNRPVEEVTWYDCCIYCNRLSQAEGLTPCYYSDASFTTVFDGTPPVTSGTVYWNQSANGYRLPTEAEWEYACRAGTTTAYNSGQDNTDCEDDPNLDPLGRYRYNGGSSSHHADVGSYQANNRGLYDMHGNVWEWCWDWYSSGYYSSSPSTDPSGPSSGSNRVRRGGSWVNYARSCRSANRGSGTPGYRYDSLGFRVLRTTY